MFLALRPHAARIERFIQDSRELPLSYSPVGIAGTGTARDGRHDFDEAVAAIGRGKHDFERARASLFAWKHFDIGWVELFPEHARVETGTNVAVLIRHFGFWSLNGCRVVYDKGARDQNDSCGFAYGTLTNHAEAGEELFEVFRHPQTDDVMYRIRAISWPRVALMRLGYPVVRLLQARFRRDSVAAMKRATSGKGDRR